MNTGPFSQISPARWAHPDSRRARHVVGPGLFALIILYCLTRTLFATAGPQPPPGAPLAYGQWSAMNGIISDTACADVNVSCTPIAAGDGFRYELVDTPNGRFARMIMTDAGVSGNQQDLGFSTETYTPMLMRAAGSGAFVMPDGTIAQGIASRQIVRDNAGTFESMAEIQRGFARKVLFAGSPTDAEFAQAWSTKIEQRLVDAGATSDITESFSVITYTDVPSGPASAINTDKVRGQLVDIGQEIVDTASGKKQKFERRMRSGSTGWTFWCNQWGGVCPPGITAGGSLTLGGTPINWSAGQSVAATWVGSNIGSPVGITMATGTEAQVSPPPPGCWWCTPTTSLVMTSGRQLGFVDPQPAGPWPGATSADLNWPLEPNVPDPFTDINSPLALPALSRTAPAFP